MNTRNKKETTPFGVVFLFGMALELGLEQIKCGADERFCKWFVTITYYA